MQRGASRALLRPQGRGAAVASSGQLAQEGSGASHCLACQPVLTLPPSVLSALPLQ